MEKIDQNSCINILKSLMQNQTRRKTEVLPQQLGSLDMSAGLWWKENALDYYQEDRLELSLVIMAFNSPNLSACFNVAYQHALRLMFKELRASHKLACLCISEQGGNGPKAIECEYQSGFISGTKTFVTCAPQVEELYVMVNDKSKQSLDRDTKDLKIIRIQNVQSLVQSKENGFDISVSPPAKFLPDIDKGYLHLEQFQIDEEQVLEGNAHESYSKPFSVLEGLCIRLANVSYLLKWAQLLDWSESLKSDLISQIVLLSQCVKDPFSELSQIIIDSQNRQLTAMLEQVEPLIAKADSQLKQMWQRDKVCFFMDIHYREQRLEGAWKALKGE